MILDLSDMGDMMILDLPHQADTLHDIRPIENNKRENYHIRTSEHSKIKDVFFSSKIHNNEQYVMPIAFERKGVFHKVIDFSLVHR